MNARPAVYLDYNATTPVAPQVLDAMLPYLGEQFGNPSSSHPRGRMAAQAVAQARDRVAALIGARSDEVVFTGCATEANNLALLGVARALGGGPRHLIVSAVEHPAVMEPARQLEALGWSVSVVPVDRTGRVSVNAVVAALRPETALVSVMHANNEVGTIQPVAQIAREVRARGVLMHTDAAQSAGKIEVQVDELGVDLLTLAGHKFYAPKGVGALYVRSGTRVHSILFGADQEQGLRPGTENVPAIVGMGAAAQLAHTNLPAAGEHLRRMRDRLHEQLASAIPGLLLNGHPEERLPNTLHLSFPGVTGRALLQAAESAVSASLGSACHSATDAVSGVMAAMGIDPLRATGAVRLSVGLVTTEQEVDFGAAALIAAWQHASGTWTEVAPRV